MFTSKLQLGLEGIGRVYGSFYTGLGIFLALVAASNFFLFTPILRQQITYIGHFGVLYTALGFVNLFSFTLLGKRGVGRALLSLHIVVALLFLAVELPMARGAKLLAESSYWFRYWDPLYSHVAAYLSLALVLFAAAIYSRFLFKIGIESQSAIIRKKSFLFAIGSIIAAFSGASYFVAPLLSEAARPYVVAMATLPGILGFTLMVLPLFLKEKQTPASTS